MQRSSTHTRHLKARRSAEQFFLVAQELQNLVNPVPVEFESKRREKRQPRTLSISVQPLDEDFQNDGDVFWLVSRDISLRGIGMVSYDRIDHRFVRLGLIGESVSVIGKVRHNTSIGNEYPLYLVGVEFLNEMDFA